MADDIKNSPTANSEFRTTNYEFFDTHCHIHEADYPGGGEAAYQRALAAGVERMICVGTDERTSAEAIAFADAHDNVWASVGLHPHDAVNGMAGIQKLQSLANSELRIPNSKIIAVGECGLDYFYENSPKKYQQEALHFQIELALKHNLPLIFHVRDSFDDFWQIFDQYQSASRRITGVVHSFTDTQENLEKALERGLYIGVNGISTFTKVESQKQMFASIPLKNLLLETDAPFLTPVPKRGTINEPAFVKLVASHMADLRNISLQELSAASSQNATTLFRAH